MSKTRYNLAVHSHTLHIYLRERLVDSKRKLENLLYSNSYFDIKYI